MSYEIQYQGKPLSYFYGNSNGKVVDFMGFGRSKSWKIFNTRKEAEDYIQYMRDTIKMRGFDIAPVLSIKLYEVINKLKIIEV